jgi:hypothetical protein
LALALGCVPATGPAAASGVGATPVWVRSHNRSAVDVYLLCEDRDALWLGEVSVKGTDAFDIPAERPYCLRGLNFFVVVRSLGRGYWVGPVKPRPGSRVELVIERYARLSSARVLRGW